ncbi:MAG TPA: cation:proton antiporter [Chloroflexota bacterium]|nr:cation:proton antiporter [Chloroflexota bacterium]
MGHTSLLLSIAVILLGAKLVEALSRRVGLPPVLGEVLYGVAIGPSVLGWVEPNETITLLGSLGVVLLLFVAGLETRVAELKAVGGAAMLTATGGVVVPFILGYFVGTWFGLGLVPSLFLGTILTATSVSISAETLRAMGRLRTKAGTTIMGAAIVDDVMGLMVLAGVAAVGEGGSLWLPALRVVAFAVAALVLGLWALPHLMHAAESHLSRDALLALVLAVVLVYAWAAAQLGGLADITGAYLAGLLVGRTRFQSQAAEGALTLGYGLLIPIFLVWVGLQADVGALALAPALALAVTAVAVVGKLIGCYAGARSQLAHRDAVWVAVAMISRGEVALVVASVGRTAGLVDERVFSAAIAMTLATTLLTPLALRLLARERGPAPVAAAIDPSGAVDRAAPVPV